jgi:hypothetical protein
LAFKLQVEGEPREVEGVGDEEFGLESGGGKAVFGEVAGGGFEDGKKGHTIAI